MKHHLVFALCALVLSRPLAAQETSFIYRLGKDTVAIERSMRAPTTLSGDVINRQGVLVVRTSYDATLRDGKVSSMTYRIFGADGNPIAGRPREVRFDVTADSVKRTITWADSLQVRTFAAVNAMPFIASSYSLLEMPVAAMRATNTARATYPALSTNTGAGLASFPLEIKGDTVRQPSGLVMIFDKNGLLQSVDGSSTTAKIMATRSNTRVDIAALMNGMKPTGVLSGRGTARAAFQSAAGGPGGVVMIDYGRPLMRDRTVWGGTLIPLDTIWRLGANDATHFATGRDLVFGDVTVPAGLYTLFLYNARSGPMLVVNKQVGQWGTAYDQAKDLVRIPLTLSALPGMVDEFTINLRQSAPNLGAVEIRWGDKMAVAPFTVK